MNGEAQKDQAVAQFQQAQQMAMADQQNAQLELDDLSDIAFQAQAVEPLGQAALQTSLQDAQALFQLPLPQGPQFVCFDAGLVLLDLEGLRVRKAALQKRKAELEATIQKLREEAERKRRVADMPVSVFGINGIWYVRWSAIERTYNSEAEARSSGVSFVETLRNARRREAMELDARADGLEQELQQVCMELDQVCATIDFLDIDFQNKAPACDQDPISDPDDDEDPRVHYKSFIDFDTLYLDDVWLEMFREWQRAKDRLRAQLIAMGASQETIDAMEERWDSEREWRPKWMNVFCDEPIKLKLLTVNQFTDFEFDVDNAKWEVEYKDLSTLTPIRVQVGTGGELCIPPEQVKEIFAEARRIQNGFGKAELIDIYVSFDKVYEDGSRDPCFKRQQISVYNWTREAYESIFLGLRQ